MKKSLCFIATFLSPEWSRWQFAYVSSSSRFHCNFHLSVLGSEGVKGDTGAHYRCSSWVATVTKLILARFFIEILANDPLSFWGLREAFIINETAFLINGSEIWAGECPLASGGKGSRRRAPKARRGHYRRLLVGRVP